MTDANERAFRAMRSSEVPDGAVSGFFRDALPLGGVSVSSFGPLAPSETISSSDDLASRIDEIQFDLTEGPCWTALERRSPVFENDLVERPNGHWPAFNDAVRHEPVRAVFAFPIIFGPFPLGAVDVYAEHPTELDDDQVDAAAVLATALGRRVLRRALRAVDEDDALVDHGPFSRRVVHQATGVVLAQLDVTPDDAYLLIQGHAFARRTTMRAVAEDVLAGAIRFEKHGDLIEEA